jgi:hypothetical protein
MTAVDMNRITGDIDYLFDYATAEGHAPAGSTVPKTSWTKNDIIERSTWEATLETLSNLCECVEYNPEANPTNEMEFENINNVEQISFNLYNIIGQIGNLQGLNHWAGDDLFAGDPVNAGGTY